MRPQRAGRFTLMTLPVSSSITAKATIANDASPIHGKAIELLPEHRLDREPVKTCDAPRRPRHPRPSTLPDREQQRSLMPVYRTTVLAPVGEAGEAPERAAPMTRATSPMCRCPSRSAPPSWRAGERIPLVGVPRTAVATLGYLAAFGVVDSSFDTALRPIEFAALTTKK